MDAIPFHRPSLNEDDIEAVVGVLREGWVTTGPRCREFEEGFAHYLAPDGSEELHCIAVNSGTAALHLGLEAAGVAAGDLVLTPSFTFTASAEVSRYLGADPWLVDNEPGEFVVGADTFIRAYEALDKKHRKRVKAILPVHYGGLPVDMEKLEEFCEAEGLGLVDDAAHALPTHRKGKPIGRFGQATAFSFYATKTLCTGEGGMVVTRDGAMALRMRTMRLHGINQDVFERYRQANRWYYEVVEAGYKYNMSDIMAALGLSQLQRIDAFRDRREAIARAYSEAFAPVEGLTTPPEAEPGDLHAWHLYPLRVAGGRALRDALIAELARREIGTSVHFIPLHRQPYYRDHYGLRPEDFPHAEALFAEEVSLPIYPDLSDGQVERVIHEVVDSLAVVRSDEGRFGG